MSEKSRKIPCSTLSLFWTLFQKMELLLSEWAYFLRLKSKAKTRFHAHSQIRVNYVTSDYYIVQQIYLVKQPQRSYNTVKVKIITKIQWLINIIRAVEGRKWRPVQDVLDVFWTSYIHSIYVLCLRSRTLLEISKMESMGFVAFEV